MVSKPARLYVMMQLEDILIFSGIDALAPGKTIFIPNSATDTPYEPPAIIYQRMKLNTTSSTRLPPQTRGNGTQDHRRAIMGFGI